MTIDEARLALHDGLAGSFWVKAFALVAWFAWAQVAAAVATETVALIRGRTARPRAGLAWAQQLAAHLVGAVVVASSMTGPVSPAGAAARPPVRGRRRRSLTHRAVRGAAEPHGRPRRVALVELADPHDDGAQSAWPDLWDANHGRSFGTRTFDDPNLILPGWAARCRQPCSYRRS